MQIDEQKMRNCIYILILGLLISIDSWACSCDTSSVYESYENNNYIFVGQIIKAEFVNDTDTLFDKLTIETDYKYTFRVFEIFKGDSVSEIEIRTERGSSCSFPLIFGEFYLVYSYKRNGHQRTGMCTRTRDLDDRKNAKNDIRILRDLREKNAKNQYRWGCYQSESKDSYFKFYNSGRFCFRNKDADKVIHGQGQYIFKNDSLVLDFEGEPKNESKEFYSIYPDTLCFTRIKILAIDYDLNTPITDFKVKITDKSGAVVIEKEIDADTITINLDKKLQLDTLYFYKTGYPIIKTDFFKWDSRDLHEIKLKWQENFDTIKKQKVICRLTKDNITDFKIDNKYNSNTGYNTQYSKWRRTW